jgi:mannose-6-phosphate isomerase-like protein (cupin superfamily)
MARRRDDAWHWTVAEAAGRGPDPGRASAGVFARSEIEVRYFAPYPEDRQSPHSRDELYFVARGRAVFERERDRLEVVPGDVLLVPAQMPHRFVEMSEDFATWVVFYPGTEPGS